MYRLHRFFQVPSKIAIVSLLLLGFFEAPWWCHGNQLCRKAAYPTFVTGDMFLTTDKTMLIEIGCLFVLVLQFLVEKEYLGEQFWKGRQSLVWPLWVKNVTVWFYFIDTILSSQYTLDHFGVRFAPYCRVLLFVCAYRSVWDMVGVMSNIIPEVADLGIVIVLFICMSSWLAVTIFDQGLEHIKYVSSFTELTWELSVLLSNNLFPDIMMPAYDYDRTTGFFWIAYMIIGYFVLKNIAFGVLFMSFREHQESFHERRNLQIDRSLEDSFRALDLEQRGCLTATTVAAFLEFELGRKSFPQSIEVAYSGGRLSDQTIKSLPHRESVGMVSQVRSLAASYSRDTSAVGEGDGSYGGGVLEKQRADGGNHIESIDNECFKQIMLHVMSATEAEESTWLQRTFPELYYTDFMKRLTYFVSRRKIQVWPFDEREDDRVNHLLFESLIDVILVINFLLLLAAQVGPQRISSPHVELIPNVRIPAGSLPRNIGGRCPGCPVLA